MISIARWAFAIGGAAPDGRADAGRVFGIDPVQIERDVIADGAASGQAQRLFHHRAHATLVDVAHGEDVHAGAANVLALVFVHVADADQHTIFRPHLGTEAIHVAEWRVEQPHDGTERHAMNVAAGRGFGRVDVAVGVDPQQPDALVLATVKLSQPETVPAAME